MTEQELINAIQRLRELGGLNEGPPKEKIHEWVKEKQGPKVETKPGFGTNQTHKKQYIIICGDFGSGFVFFGPFRSYDKAVAWGKSVEDSITGRWVVKELNPVVEE